MFLACRPKQTTSPAPALWLPSYRQAPHQRVRLWALGECQGCALNDGCLLKVWIKCKVLETLGGFFLNVGCLKCVLDASSVLQGWPEPYVYGVCTVFWDQGNHHFWKPYKGGDQDGWGSGWACKVAVSWSLVTQLYAHKGLDRSIMPDARSKQVSNCSTYVAYRFKT